MLREGFEHILVRVADYCQLLASQVHYVQEVLILLFILEKLLYDQFTPKAYGDTLQYFRLNFHQNRQLVILDIAVVSQQIHQRVYPLDLLDCLQIEIVKGEDRED